MLSEQTNPSFVGRRQQHINFTARATMDFSPQSAGECAGIVLLQNCDYHFRFVVTKAQNQNSIVRLVKREQGVETILAEKHIGAAGRIHFKVEAVGQSYSFSFTTGLGPNPKNSCTSSNKTDMNEPFLVPASSGLGAWQKVAQAVDGRILSTPVAGGFVGAYIGMYASSNGQPGQNVADFDSFEYRF
jgi:alpha-N-arabinofuranosidase